MIRTPNRMWLRRGLSLKRWALLLVAGVLLASLAVAMGIAWVYRTYDLPDGFTRLVQLATLQAIPHPVRGLLMFGLGSALLLLACWRMLYSLLAPFIDRSSPGSSVARIVAEHHFGTSRPGLNVVVIGGGTGLATALRGLRQADVGITAIVTVADDGGSTGRLREDFAMPAPGDIRNCIVALSDAESTVGKLFDYRFTSESESLSGHSFGNLFIAALTQVTGDFEQAVIESGRVLNTRGRVLPTTLEHVQLGAILRDGSTVLGETAVGHSVQPIDQVFLEPRLPAGYEPAIAAILAADLIVLGPGSLFTSVLPNLMVSGVREAIRFSPGRTVYVCNVATQTGETDDFGVDDHVQAILRHLGPGTLDVVLANGAPAHPGDASGPVAVVAAPTTEVAGLPLVRRDLVDPANPLRHDSERLATALLALAPPPTPGRPAAAPARGQRTA